MTGKVKFYTGNPLCQSVDFLYTASQCHGDQLYAQIGSLRDLSAQEKVIIPVSIVWQNSLSRKHFTHDHEFAGNTYLLDRLDPPSLDALRSQKAILFVDYSGEGAQMMPEVFLDFHGELNAKGIAASSVVLINENVVLKAQYEAWCADVGLQPIHILAYNHAIYHFCGTIFATQIAEKEQRRRTILNLQKSGAPRAKTYVCLNNMPRTHRYALVAYLHAKGFDQKGWLSCLTKLNEEYVEHVWADVRALTSHFPITRDQFDSMLHAVPLEADTSSSTARGELSGRLGGNDMYASSYVSIVTESEFGSGEKIRLTEKIYKPIANLQPFILFGPPGALKLLQDAGFKRQHPIIDESYDELTDPVERFTALLEHIHRFCAMSDAEWGTLNTELSDILQYNYDWIWSARDRYPGDQIHDDIRQLVRMPRLDL